MNTSLIKDSEDISVKNVVNNFLFLFDELFLHLDTDMLVRHFDYVSSVVMERRRVSDFCECFDRMQSNTVNNSGPLSYFFPS